MSSNLWQKFYRLSRVPLIALLILIILRLAMPFAVKAYVNHQLSRIPDFEGTVRDIDIHLWRGAYTIHDLKLLKNTGGIPIPFFQTEMMDLSVEWKALFHGAMVAEIQLLRPYLNFVDGPTADQTQISISNDWRTVVKGLFPFKINRLEIDDGQIHFRNLHSEPRVDIHIYDLGAVATNLTNARGVKEALSAGLSAEGRTLGGGELSVHLKAQPLASHPTFELAASLTNLALVELNDFLRAYGKFDVERGTAAIFTEVAAADGRYEGYIKPVLEDIDVFAWEKERKKSILQVFWHAIVGTTSAVFKNHPNDRLATRIPVSGDFEKSRVGIWSAVGGVLQNAFIRSIVPKLDHTVKFENVQKE